MIVLKVLAVAFFAFSWWRSKRTKTIEPSDFFYISFLVIYVPGFLVNPSGNSLYNHLKLSPASAYNAQIGLLSVLVVGIIILTLRRFAETRLRFLSAPKYFDDAARALPIVSIAAAILSALIALALALTPSFVEYKEYVGRFFTLQLSGVAYRFMRNYGFYDSVVVNSVLERARFTIFPILYVFSIAAFMVRGRFISAFLCAAVFFYILPASLSKLPIAIYGGYFLVYLLTRYSRLTSVGWLVVISVIASALLVEALSLLYIAQYAGSVASGQVSPVSLALQRIWGEPYSIIVRYYEAYPGILDFTGWDGISLIARLVGHETRMPDIEVANRILGPDSGSNPAVFFLAGYAAFGQVGLVIFAGLGFAGLWLVDIIGRHLHFSFLQAAYLAIMGVNVLFLNQIALQTAVLTYGLGVVPLVFLFIDALLLNWQRRKLANAVKDGNPGLS